MNNRVQKATRMIMYREVEQAAPRTVVSLYLWEIDSEESDIVRAQYDLAVVVMPNELVSRPQVETYHHFIDKDSPVPFAIRQAIAVSDHYMEHGTAPEWFGKQQEHEDE